MANVRSQVKAEIKNQMIILSTCNFFKYNKYVGWTDKGICAIVQELNLCESKTNPN